MQDQKIERSKIHQIITSGLKEVYNYDVSELKDAIANCSDDKLLDHCERVVTGCEAVTGLKESDLKQAGIDINELATGILECHRDCLRNNEVFQSFYFKLAKRLNIEVRSVDINKLFNDTIREITGNTPATLVRDIAGTTNFAGLHQ